MLTARSEEDDELQGFSLGVDEYIAKPFSLKILLARIEAVFRRGAPEEPAARPVVDGLLVDPVGREVKVDGQPVELTYTEFELLTYLMTNSGVALSRDKILDSVWRYDYYGDAARWTPMSKSCAASWAVTATASKPFGARVQIRARRRIKGQTYGQACRTTAYRKRACRPCCLPAIPSCGSWRAGSCCASRCC